MIAMPTKSMTTRWVETLRPPAISQVDYFDEKQPGLVLRISNGGRKTWCVLYRVRGRSKKRRLTLAAYPTLTLAEARDLAKASVLAASQGLDPAHQKQLEKGLPTFAAVAEEYLRRHASQKRSGAEDARILTRDVLPDWGERLAKDIQRRDVIRLLDRICDRGAPIQSNRTLALVRTIFNWAIGRDLVDFNPCSQVKPVAREHQRTRVLSMEEIKVFWDRLDGAAMAELTRTTLWLILATAQRPGEVTRAEWEEFDFEDGWWTIPGEKAKNRMPHRVPMLGIAKSMIQALPRQSAFLFPSAATGRPINVQALSHAIRRQRASWGIPHFTPHDLRRTAASQMTGLGVSRLVVGKILNHVETGVTAIYDRHSYDSDKVDAFTRWDQAIAAILSDRTFASSRDSDTVVSMH